MIVSEDAVCWHSLSERLVLCLADFLVTSRDVKLEFFSKSKLESKKSIRWQSIQGGVQAKPRLWWSAAEVSEPTPPAKSVRHVGQGTLGM